MRHDTRNPDSGQYTERDVFDFSDRKPPNRLVRGYEPDRYSDLSIDLTSTGSDSPRMGSGANAIGDAQHAGAGSYGGRDLARDDFGVDEQNKAKTAGQVEPPPRESDWVGPRPLGESAYIRGERERKDTSWG
jgi:hypothetical protein